MISLDRQGQWYEILKGDATSLQEETRAQEAQLGLFKGCQLKVGLPVLSQSSL